MTLTFDARLTDRSFDLSFSVEQGETIAVMGPNGAGKSTLLGLLAGLLRADSGSARLDDVVLFGGGSGEPSWTPPHRRGVALLAQEPLLFPHLTALDNVAFGPRSAGASRRDAREVARGWLTEVDAGHLAARRPAQLSGGQAGRIAAARALAANPRLLLLDEPMSALDIAAAPALRRLLRRVLVDRTALLVTHDPLDALLLADRVLVIDHGHLVEQGPTREVFARPRTPFMAGLAGLNLLTGVRSARGLTLNTGEEIEVAVAPEVRPGAALGLVVRPSAVRITQREPDGATESFLRQTILDLEPRGDAIRIRGERLSADLSPRDVVGLDLQPGETAWFAFARASASTYPL